ncbi:TPA: hypothetical protein QDZ34_001186 [Stenotrophomonas maltophilia]|nr:hypothetical protein [Stenotrophomonas maltophilia]HDS1024490.1 hypothetical protein [Stenotrophomonas maltophilia]HDS1029222.1 hypothetical protein [Stenotrophomonas maltophilia]HDS1033855.1 hypothetical protein [Stenotrophomonas maltophilia]
MSAPIPPIPTPPATPRSNNWVGPVAMGSFWLCLLLAVYFVLQGLVALPLRATPFWQHLVSLAWEHRVDRGLWWMLANPVGASLGAALLCLASAAASWGLWRERLWGLWGYVWALLLSAAANFVIAWWLDRVLRQLIALIADNAAMAQELNMQRLLFTVTLVGTSVLFAGMQGWLAWRLLRPDIRARYR